MVDGAQIPVRTKLLFRGDCHRFRGGVRLAAGVAVFQLPPGLCLRARCCNELPQKFPAARLGWGAPAAAAGDRGCAERQGPRHRHTLHRWEVSRAPVCQCRLPARRLRPAGAGWVAGRGRDRGLGGCCRLSARAPGRLGEASAGAKTRLLWCPLLPSLPLSLLHAEFSHWLCFLPACFPDVWCVRRSLLKVSF